MPASIRMMLALLTCGIPLYSQSWDALRSLKPGDPVKVLDTAGREHHGWFAAVSAGAITLRTSNSEMAIERARVRRVQVRSNSRRARKALIGAAIGAAVGVAVDQSVGAYVRNETGESGAARALTYIGPIALFGGVAAAFPAYRTLYRAP